MPVAVHILVRRGDEVLLLRRFRTGYEDGRYSVPAGHLDGGESVLQAAAREAREECAIEIEGPVVAGVMHRHHGDGERIDFFVRAERWRGAIRNAEPDKCDDLRFAPLGRLPRNVIPYVRTALENRATEPWFMAYGWPVVATPRPRLRAP